MQFENNQNMFSEEKKYLSEEEAIIQAFQASQKEYDDAFKEIQEVQKAIDENTEKKKIKYKEISSNLEIMTSKAKLIAGYQINISGLVGNLSRKSEMDVLEQKLGDLNKEYEVLYNKNDKLEKDINEINEKISDLNTTKKKLDDLAKQLERNLNRHKVTFEGYKNLNSQLKSSIESQVYFIIIIN